MGHNLPLAQSGTVEDGRKLTTPHGATDGPNLTTPTRKGEAMLIYRNSYYDDSGESRGFSFFPSYTSAKRDAQKNKHVRPITDSLIVRCSKDGILRALNSLAKHPDNG